MSSQGPSQYVSRKEIAKQYHPKGYGLSPGLQRARAPFRTRNAITGSIIGLFVVGVYAYSIRAVQQDNFQDLDEEAKALLQSRMSDANVRPGTGVPVPPDSPSRKA